MSTIDHWAADPSWPLEQQLLFQRLKNRFAAQLGEPTDEPEPNGAQAPVSPLGQPAQADTAATDRP